MFAAQAGWCPDCCTRHGEQAQCPSEHPLTEEETLQKRLMYLTPRGWEIYGIMVAPTSEYYRARIASLPRTLWTIPGGMGTMKFLGRSKEEVTTQADRFVEEYCRKRGYQPIADVTIEDPSGEEPEPLVYRREGRSAPRKNALLWALWGTEQPTEEARTYNISVDGLFLVSSSTVESGTPVRILLNIGDHKLQLQGTVVWRRQQAKNGKPAGMGILLSRPPDRYIDYVRHL